VGTAAGRRVTAATADSRPLHRRSVHRRRRRPAFVRRSEDKRSARERHDSARPADRFVDVFVSAMREKRAYIQRRPIQFVATGQSWQTTARRPAEASASGPDCGVAVAESSASRPLTALSAGRCFL